MADALATLPWVEKDSIKTSGATLQAKFTVTDPKAFDEAQLVAVLKKKGYPGAKLEAGPPKAQ